MTPVGIHVCDQSGAADVVVSLGDDATVADVFDVLGLPAQTLVDGQPIASPATTAAREVLHGGVSLGTSQPQGTPPPSVEGFVDVGVVAGLDAGASVRLGSGLFHLLPDGAGPEGSWLLQVDPRDPLFGAPRPWHEQGQHLEALERCSESVLAVSPPVDPEKALSPTIYRPPIGRGGAPVLPIEVGDVPDVVREPSPLSWATLLAPLPVALLMAFFFRPLFALFAAMGPVMALGRWWESRRRYRRAVAARARALADVRTDVRRQLGVQAEIEAQRRWLENPHIAALWQRATGQSVRLWERRPGADGFLRAVVGVGADRCPSVLAESKAADELRDLVDAPLQLRTVPHTIDLAAHAGIGICGLRRQALAVARSLVAQLATLQGPADLHLGVLCSPSAASDWDWLKWLPHLDQALVGWEARDVLDGVSQIEVGEGSDVVTRLIVVDAPQSDVARLIRAATRAGSEIRVLAVGADLTELPAVCSTTVVIHGATAAASAFASVAIAGRNDTGPSITPTGISDATAQSWARQLAGLHDPEERNARGQKSGAVSLLQLVGRTALNELGARWADRDAAKSPVVTLGVGVDGAFQLDLTSDGPHALVAGTTGSGKSELLRSLVIGLAVDCPPQQLNFVLVDFKGGGAFDGVRDLPHVVGVITDLDEALVARALVSLRAELERREQLFRDLGVSSYQEAVASAAEPIARLVIVVDEFATLATDYSELMTAIIDLATRGRSLGMYLVLATQRPSGVVDQKIRANTNVRIALRVQDAFDSQDVVGVPDAARIDRQAPGRAIVRIGGDRAVEVQMAFTGAPDRNDEPCAVRPHRLFNGVGPTPVTPRPEAAETRTELQVIVDTIIAVSESNEASTRALWAPPLPAMLDWIDLGTRELSASAPAPGFALGLADLPAGQKQLPWRWEPSTGPLGIYAASGVCAGKALVSLGAAMASATGPDSLHMYVVDGDAGITGALMNLAHTGAYIRKGETDRVERVIRLFEETLDMRRSVYAPADPQLVLIIDNVAAVFAMFDDMQVSALTDRLAAIGRDGATLGVHLVVSARTPRDISHRIAQQIPNRLALALSDPSGYLALGIKLRDVVPLSAMRAIDVQTRHIVQLVEPPDLASWSTSNPEIARSAPGVYSFPLSLGFAELEPAAISAHGTLHIPVGIDSEDLDQAELILRPAEHALVVGAPGMGRSTTAAVITRQLDRGGVQTVRVVPYRSPLTASDNPGQLVDNVGSIEELMHVNQRTVVVVDDADSLTTDMAAALEQLIDHRNECVHVVAATTIDAARSTRSWTARIRSGGTGILIGGARSDGEIFKVRLGPLDGRGVVAGRGNLIVRGRTLGVQLSGLNAVA